MKRVVRPARFLVWSGVAALITVPRFLSQAPQIKIKSLPAYSEAFYILYSLLNQGFCVFVTFLV